MMNIKATLSQVHWKLVLVMAVLIYIVTFILGLGLSLLWQAFLGGDHVEPHRAIQTISLISSILVMVVTGYGAWLAARKIKRAAPLHGFLIGLVVALISLILDVVFSGALTLVGLLLYVLMIAAGWLGGVLGRRRRAAQ